MTTHLELAAAIPQLDPRDHSFAHSLAGSRRWSEKQEMWATKLVERARQRTSGEPEAPKQAGLERIVEMFDKAAEKLKFPRINVTPELVLKRTGQNSKAPGAVNVTTRGGFGAATWFGRIERDGSLTAGHSMTADVRGMLQAIANDPERAAQEYGKRHGLCCFCNAELSDHRSIEVGYGPVCAEHYGLNWGSKVREPRPLKASREASLFDALDDARQVA
jgi:hypothetical protein